MRNPPTVFGFVSAPPLTLPLSISCRLGGNTIGDKGGSALAAILKETQITELQCAPIESVRFCVSAVDSPAYISIAFALPHTPYLYPLQSRTQRYWRRGRLSACCHPQRDDDLHTQVCRAAPRLDTLARHFHPTPRSHRLGDNQVGAEGAAALADILHKTNITNLECAATNNVFAVFSSAFLNTRLILSLSPPCMQLGRQQPHQQWKRCVRPAQARGSPSVDQDCERQVRRRLKRSPL